MLPRSRWWTVAPILLSVVFAAAVLPVIFLGSDATSEATDEAVAHLPAVRQFAAELPAPDLSDYPSATSPGYHLLMSLPARAGLGVHGLRVLGSLAGLALVLLAWRMAAACAGPAVALALALPLACSTYVLSGCAWLTTDVLSVLIASATVAVAAFMPPRPRTFVALAALVASALAVRQTNIALAGPVLAAGILGSPLGNSASNAEQWRGDAPRSWGRLAMAVAALVPGALLLAALVRTWGGLTPPAFRSLHDRGLSPVAPAYGLALVGAWSVPLLLPMLPEVVRSVRRHAPAVACVVLAAVAGALVPESTLSVGDGRWGGAMWVAVGAFPSVAGRSSVLVAAAAVGALALSVLWIRAAEIGRGRQASVVLVGLLAVFAVQAGNSQVWQRYFDPAVLVALCWLTALGIDRTRPHSAGRAVAGAGLLTAAQCILSAMNYLRPAFWP